MLEGYGPVFQTFLGTLFTWGLTAAGAGLVFVFNDVHRKVLDGSLGFAAGVMTAASYWSLLDPAIEMASTSGYYGEDGKFAFVPVAIGFGMGAAFVHYADVLMTLFGLNSTNILSTFNSDEIPTFSSSKSQNNGQMDNSEATIIGFNQTTEHSQHQSTVPRRRGQQAVTGLSDDNNQFYYNEHSSKDSDDLDMNSRKHSWRRILLLILAITIHNIPEGLAVGVGFGAIGKSSAATFESARNLAVGIGIQNFPEGLAVSLPLRGFGMSPLRSFWYGQLSGMVEPVAGILGAVAVSVAEPILPYALAFAAGAMIYVVVDDIIPEAQTCGNGKVASLGAIVGFIVMMSLDVGLG